ncbi:MAG: hypothetical protein ACJ8MR_05585 [Povalibacter sp.]
MATMLKYKDIEGDSGIAAYEIGPRSIKVKFSRDGTYLYDDSVPGTQHVIEMQRRARMGKGLNTYINRYVRGNYREKLS